MLLVGMKSQLTVHKKVSENFGPRYFAEVVYICFVGQETIALRLSAGAARTRPAERMGRRGRLFWRSRQGARVWRRSMGAHLRRGLFWSVACQDNLP